MRDLWAYAYQIVPPQSAKRLGTIRALLKNETAEARGRTRTWSGTLVLGRRATNILIVSDARGRDHRDHPVNRRLEAELERLEVAFSVTEPLAVMGHAAGAKALSTSNANGR